MNEDHTSLHDVAAYTVASYAIADNCQRRLADYLVRGRDLKGASTEDLKALLQDSFAAWAQDPYSPAILRKAGEVICEYELRGVEPPMCLVSSYVHALSQNALRAISALSAASRLEFAEKLKESFDKAMQSRI